MAASITSASIRLQDGDERPHARAGQNAAGGIAAESVLGIAAAGLPTANAHRTSPWSGSPCTAFGSSTSARMISRSWISSVADFRMAHPGRGQRHVDHSRRRQHNRAVHDMICQPRFRGGRQMRHPGVAGRRVAEPQQRMIVDGGDNLDRLDGACSGIALALERIERQATHPGRPVEAGGRGDVGAGHVASAAAAASGSRPTGRRVNVSITRPDSPRTAQGVAQVMLQHRLRPDLQEVSHAVPDQPTQPRR